MEYQVPLKVLFHNPRLWNQIKHSYWEEGQLLDN